MPEKTLILKKQYDWEHLGGVGNSGNTLIFEEKLDMWKIRPHLQNHDNNNDNNKDNNDDNKKDSNNDSNANTYIKTISNHIKPYQII